MLNSSRQSLSRAAGRASRSLARSTSRPISLVSSRAAFLAQPSLRLPQLLAGSSIGARWNSTDSRFGSSFSNVASEPSKNLYIGNLFFDTTPDQLKSLFSKWGEVVNINIPTDVRGFVRGYGFVSFDTIEESNRARTESNGTLFNGRRLVVSFAAKRTAPEDRVSTGAAREPTSTLFVGNLSYTMTDADLDSLFRPLHKICDVRVAVDRRTGQPRGFAHADFLDVPSAMSARTLLEGKLVQGRELKVDFAITREKPAPRKPLSEIIAEEQSRAGVGEIAVPEEIAQAIESGEVAAETNSASFETSEATTTEAEPEAVIEEATTEEAETLPEETKAQHAA